MPEIKKQTLPFQAEVKQLLDLMVHSLYSNKEIFLRELISNASDAADKLRFESLNNPDLLITNEEFKIWVQINKNNNTISIRDNGIGMSKDDIINNLGTIAKSGTREFLNTLTGDVAKDSKLIGQFGVGFYSSFIVSKKVEVITKKAGLDHKAIKWSSNCDGQYTIEDINEQDRGTEVILHLKSEEKEFISEWKIRQIIVKYSDHITLPIIMKNDKTGECETINKATALWTLAKNDITDQQYEELYKHIAHDFESPLIWSHNRVEGKSEYISLIYIPSKAPFDLWTAYKSRGLKLYVNRIFIMDDAEQFLPNYLRFVRGIIDSNDLPLNISREILQGSKIINNMRNALVKRILLTIEKLSIKNLDKYKIFWKEFGKVIKEGPAEDFGNKEIIANLLRFSSTYINKEEQNVSLKDYVSRMRKGQEKIYYVAADSFETAQSSPNLEVFKDRNFEVLLLIDRVDEWLMMHLTEFNNIKFQSVTKGGVNFDKSSDISDKKNALDYKELENNYQPILLKIKKLFEQRVKNVRLTKRLTSSPACIVVDDNDMAPQMSRIMQAAGQEAPKSKPILELNPHHKIVKKLIKIRCDDEFKNWSALLLDQAILSEGGYLKNPAEFIKRINGLMLNIK